MFKFKFVLIIFLIISGVSCSHDTHQHDDVGTELTLNDGKKWHSDKHTMNSVNSMREIVFNKKTISDDSLKKSLDTELGNLINGCTMEGAHHDALHVYLEELMPLIEKLGSTDKKILMDTKKELRKLLTLYPDFFELN